MHRAFTISLLILFSGCGVSFKEKKGLVRLNDLIVENPTRLTSSFIPLIDTTSLNVFVDKVHLKNKLITNGVSGELSINELFIYPKGEIRSFSDEDVAIEKTNGLSGGRVALHINKIIFTEPEKLNSLEIIFIGQKGGKGKKGVKGRKGEKGLKGDTVDRRVLSDAGYCESMPDYIRQKFGEKNYEIFVSKFPRKGKKGGTGYIGGPGYEGASGGSSGGIKVFTPLEFEKYIQIKLIGGSGGDGGDGGDGGGGGDPGDSGDIYTKPNEWAKIPNCDFDVKGELGDTGPSGAQGEKGKDGEIESAFINGRRIL